MLVAAKPENESQRLASLHELGVLFSPAENRFDRITRLACRIFDVPIALVSLVSESCQWFKSRQGLSADQTSREVSFCAHAILHDGPFVVADARTDDRFADNPLVAGEPFIRFYAGLPIRSPDGNKLGTLCLIDTEPRGMSPMDLDTLRDLGGWVENELAITRLSEAQTELISELDASRREALIDPLTQIWNRRGIMEVLDREIARSKRSAAALGVAMIDVDHFKRCNDTYGHPAGDSVLREVAARMRSSVRAYDALGRYGGEEFLVIATEIGEEGLRSASEKIRRRVEGEDFLVADASLHVTISLGATVYDPRSDGGSESLIARADNALYRAKRNGRNRTEYAAP